MEIFQAILQRLLPLYCLVLAGFILGRRLDVKKESIATVLIYFISPLVVFNGVVTARLSFSTLSLPLLIYVIASAICILVLKMTKRQWRGPTSYLAAFTAGNANSGYFGLPVGLAILGERSLGTIVLASFGFILYENTLGYFVTARGRSTARESFRKVLRLPALYAFLAGLVCSMLDWRIQAPLDEIFRNVRGAYSVLGMMMIGLGVSGMKHFTSDARFIVVTFLAKFALWPVIALTLVHLDRNFLQLNVEPEKAGAAVLLSTLFALFYIPIMALYFL
jgi:malate permease and related proteins